MAEGTIPRTTKVNRPLVESIGHPVGYAILRVLGEHGEAPRAVSRGPLA
jgi:hypothetical protein